MAQPQLAVIDGNNAPQTINTINNNGQALAASSQPMVGASDWVPNASVGQRPFEASITITRPANTTAYTAGQNINSATSGLAAFPTFALGIGNSQKCLINSVRLSSSNGSATLKLQAALALFNAASPSGGGFNDASTFNPTGAALQAAGNALFENLPNTFNTGTAALVIKGDEYAREAQTDSSGNIYAALIALNAYVPASAETITISVKGTY